MFFRYICGICHTGSFNIVFFPFAFSGMINKMCLNSWRKFSLFVFHEKLYHYDFFLFSIFSVFFWENEIKDNTQFFSVILQGFFIVLNYDVFFYEVTFGLFVILWKMWLEWAGESWYRVFGASFKWVFR